MWAPCTQLPAPRSQRRGVLLLVVLSMLVLFMLIGTAFLMSSNQSRDAAKKAAKFNRLGNYPTKLLGGALFEVLRDTENTASVVRGHSLLRDLYGTDGFEAAIDHAEYAAAPAFNMPLGPTAGQFVDIYIQPVGFKLQRDAFNQPVSHIFPATSGYYNGCLLTITSGPSAGQSTRVVAYEASVAAGLARFRVMSFGRSDGQTLVADTAAPFPIASLAGSTFLVNGRAFSGTGVGFNPFAVNPGPKLTAREGIFQGGTPPAPTPNSDVLYPPIALAPNAAYFFPFDPSTPVVDTNAANDVWGARFQTNTGYLPLNPKSTLLANRQAQWKYQSLDGPGGGNEGYDAPDFQNMALAMQTVTPRSQGRVVQGDPANPVTLNVTDPGLSSSAFLRLDLEDVPLPSFHRPDLINYWFHQLTQYLINDQSMSADDAVRAVLQPYDANGNPNGISAALAAQITALKRKISLRPLREDHPRFDGSNSLSVPQGLANISGPLLRNNNIAIPFWEAVGPWDVDNDNDGVPDSVWVDLGDPVQQADDGTLYKPLYAFLILDMDGRLNVNAHGNVDDLAPIFLDPSGKSLAGTTSSSILPRGSGYGPPEISLRPLFPVPYSSSGTPINANQVGNRFEVTFNNPPVDDYAALLAGRIPVGNVGIPGRYGFDNDNLNPGIPFPNNSPQAPMPGKNYRFVANNASPNGDSALPDLPAMIKFFNHPLAITQRTAFGTPPDLMSRYGTGLDYAGQPYYEVLNDRNVNSGFPRALLTNSPYELDLSLGVRRDNWTSGQFVDSGTEFNASLSLNDDAPFSTSDLERILRATDADVGSLPSRLWDVVSAFDPVKLMQWDRFRVADVANKAFGSSSGPEMLAAAQQMTSVYRHLVTTDSYDLPVPSGNLPNMSTLQFGPDGYPGRRTSNPPDPSQLNAPVSDDFRSIMNKDVAQAGIFDLLRYRVWVAMRTQWMLQNGVDEAGLAGMSQTNYGTFLAAVTARTNAFFGGEPFVDANNNGMYDAGDTYTETNGNGVYDGPTPQLLAPELIAGQRMDLNRPFGDGQDNFNASFPANGIVDDPLEAGDPFLDVNNNGRWDNGEPYLNADGSDDGSGNPTYTPPQDQLWAGIMSEPIAFDYTNGQGVPVYPAAFPAGTSAQVRNLSSQGRQLQARHLYCLMLLLADENYIVPYDENDRTIAGYLDHTAAGSMAKAIHDVLVAGPSPMTAVQDTKRIMLRKLTCRTIAQWAINAVDSRDPDVIMTPFEYDENPWDGWGVPVGSPLTNLPLDGDSATDENLGAVIDWTATASNGAKTISVTTTAGPGLVPAPAPLNQTRGLVWGAERPELLITETIGLHNRNTEDLASDFTKQQMEANNPQKDDDLDQRLRPKGSLFVELYNPNSPTGQVPADLYSRLTNNGTQVGVAPSDGVELGRLSTLGVNVAQGILTQRIDVIPPSDPIDPNYSNVPTSPPQVMRSPVWRMIVVEENQKLRNDSEGFDDKPDPLGTGVHKTAVNPPAKSAFKPIDPDWGQFFGQGPPTTGFPSASTSNKPYIERSIYFTSDNSPRFKQFDNDDPSGANENFLSVKPDRTGTRNLKVLVPPESPQSARYFIAADTRDVNARDKNNGKNVRDLPIARIKPGRYAVVGTAGSQYQGKLAHQTAGLDANLQPISAMAPRLVSTIARPLLGGNQAKFQTLDDRLVTNLDKARRIELLPSINPDVQQILVASNGGTPLFPNNASVPSVMRRDNEVVRMASSANFRNIYSWGYDPSGSNYEVTPDTGLIPPCVAIPIKDLSISEPLDLYVARRKQLNTEEKTRHDADPNNTTLLSHYYNPEAAMGDGMFVGGPRGQTPETPYDTPFDLAPELRRNGTTRNYRTIYLQRLADPTLPWNPLPTYPDGKSNPQHNAKLPVNLYLTIDASSVDLTAFNGASSREPDMKNTTVKDEHKWLPENKTQFRPEYGANGTQRIHFRSLERGSHATAPTKGGELALVPRLLWRHEPITRFATPANLSDLTGQGKNDMLTWLTIDPNTPGLRALELQKRADDLRLRSREELDADISEIDKSGMDNAYANTNFPTSLKPIPAQFDIVMNHSLGFQNESMGAMFSRADLGTFGLPASADGKPSPDTPNFVRTSATPLTSNVNSTFPWLAWNNRPFVSAGELLDVPAASSFQLLANFSTINSNLLPANQPNPYNGTGVDNANNPLPNPARLLLAQAPFGHLLNFFATSSMPAAVGVVNNELVATGSGNFYRLLDFVHVPSRFVGTDTMLTAEIFNDVPGVADTGPGGDITGPGDPRFKFQPPYNKLSRQRDPGRVNLNTVTGRRIAGNPATIWSDVYDGIMHRVQDLAGSSAPLGHMGPAWRDVELSRRGYAQFNADSPATPVEKIGGNPDLFASGLNPNFPSIFSNPFRSSDAGDLVPLAQLMQYGVDASMLRVHPYGRGGNKVWGPSPTGLTDARASGFGDDPLGYRVTPNEYGGIPRSDFANREILPLFSDTWNQPFADSERNPSMLYNPMTRLGNLVTNRSNVYAIWITVGYFEVEKAPDWDSNENNVRQRFGAAAMTGVDSSPTGVRGLALYNRVYPDGYMLGKEVGSDTGDIHRQRGFYIVDRTVPVGFKPGEDLNVENMIRLRRRIE